MTCIELFAYSLIALTLIPVLVWGYLLYVIVRGFARRWDA